MNEFPLNIPQDHSVLKNNENRSPLKSSSAGNISFSLNNFPEKLNFKDSSTKLKQLSQNIQSQEETIIKQKQQIQILKQEIANNKLYITTLQQKYTILLESVEPFEEKVNVEKLVDKIFELQSRFQSLQKSQNSSTSFKYLKLTQQSTQTSRNQIQSQKIHENTVASENCIEPSKPYKFANGSSQTASRSELKQTSQKSQRLKEQKLRKQSNDSQIGIQVTFLEENHLQIKKSNIEKFISMESQLQTNEINLSRKRKNSEFQQNFASLWEKLINEYLTKDESLTTKFKIKTQHLLKKGVPHQFRSTVWPMVFENPFGINWQFYMGLLERREKNWVEQLVKIQIKKDLNRSFLGKNKQLQIKEKIIEEAQQMLQLFHLYRPDISYVQGMTYPAIVLITVVGKMRGFCIFANLITAVPFFKRLYSFEGKYPSIYCRTFEILLRDSNSTAYELLQKKNINSELFLVEWFYTFFSRCLSYQTTLKIWDHLAYFGEVSIFKLGVAVVQLVSLYLADATTEGGIGLIRQFSSYIDQKKLLQAFLSSKITQEKYKKAFKKAYKSCVQI